MIASYPPVIHQVLHVFTFDKKSYPPHPFTLPPPHPFTLPSFPSLHLLILPIPSPSRPPHSFTLFSSPSLHPPLLPTPSPSPHPSLHLLLLSTPSPSPPPHPFTSPSTLCVCSTSSQLEVFSLSLAEEGYNMPVVKNLELKQR